MTDRQNEILVLALGNDIMGDDAAGLFAARALKDSFGGKIDIFEVASAGFGLIDILEGYKKVLILDSVPSRHEGPGHIMELTKDNFSNHISWSPHYAGLPELISLAEKLEINFPDDIRVLVLEITEKGIIREGLSPEIEKQIPLYVDIASSLLNEWICGKVAVYSEHAHHLMYKDLIY